MELKVVAQSSAFQKLIREKKRFILPFVLIFLTFYFTLPMLILYFHSLNDSFFGTAIWAWVFALVQFPMTWLGCVVYMRKARKFDCMVQDIRSGEGKI